MISGDINEVFMSDLLVRDVPDDVLKALDARATRLGISRNDLVSPPVNVKPGAG